MNISMSKTKETDTGKTEEAISVSGKEIRDIVNEYKFDDDIMNDEPQKVRVAKMALAKLNDADRIIFCLALDKGSSREVGKILGCSHSTVLKQLQKIKKDIMYNIMKILQEEPLED